MILNPSSTMAQIQRYINRESDEAKLRTSNQRREQLEKIASMHSGKDVYVQISGDNAYANIAKRNHKLGYTDRTIINVPAEEAEQPVTDMDQETWDLLFQKMELYHELGHVLYTDWPSFEDVLFGDSGMFGVEKNYREAFRDYWNILEDATIERLLAQRFNIGDDLKVKNENLLHANSPVDVFPSVSLHKAITLALMEYKHPTGWIDILLEDANDELHFKSDDDKELFVDEILPIIKADAPQILKTGDPVERNHAVYEMWEQIEPHFDVADQPGVGQRMTFGFPDDGEKQGDKSEGQNVDIPETDDDDDSGAFQAIAGGTDIDIQHDYEKEVGKQKQQQDQQDSDETLEKWQRVITKDYDVDTTLQLHVRDADDMGGSYNDGTRVDAERLGSTLGKEFKQRLRQARRSKKQSGQKSGKVDPTATHKTKQGKTNVFQRRTKPDDRDYNAMIIVDRSGSMSTWNDSMVPDVEAAAGALAYGLEDAGVSVGQLSFENDEIMLEKRLDEDVFEAREKMFRGFNTGGTPLSDALLLAKERLNEEGGNNFVVVLTDGEPDHRERYRDILHECNFPVLGIYVDEHGNFDEDHNNEAAYFHALELRKADEALDGVRNLVKRVMF